MPDDVGTCLEGASVGVGVRVAGVVLDERVLCMRRRGVESKECGAGRGVAKGSANKLIDSSIGSGHVCVDIGPRHWTERGAIQG